MDRLIVMALPMESQRQFDDIPVLYTGVGKVNAAYALAKAIHTRRPKEIINLGSAGSPVHRAGELVCCTRFIQRDMDVQPLGFAPFQTPFEDHPTVLENGREVEGLTAYTCGTGDNFHTDGSHEEYGVMDMEAYALAKLCHVESIPFTCIKFISDGADGAAAAEWETALKNGALLLREAYDRLSAR